jgi:DNA-binding transcriptional LysR family regulator
MSSGSGMDWDKLRVFHAAAAAGSFTHAGEALGLSQSAVSRQVSALEQDLQIPLFHRHARGLILTEQGELLFRTTQDVVGRLEQARTMLTDSRERPHGDLRVSSTVGIGTGWLAPRVAEFVDRYPDIRLQLILSDDELDLAMREADVAIRLRQPAQQDLIQRKLFNVHFHVYASPAYVERFGQPTTADDLDQHRIVAFGGPIPPYLQSLNWLATIGRTGRDSRPSVLVINSLLGLRRVIRSGVGLGVLPDYLGNDDGLVQVMPEVEMPVLEAYFAYPEELKNVARVQVFRDFLVANANRWAY